MVSRLAWESVVADADGKPLRRDEIERVIRDTLTFARADDHAALLDSWLDSI